MSIDKVGSVGGSVGEKVGSVGFVALSGDNNV